MFKNKKKKKEFPEISTASLPDIIFMLLFFFMTVTVLKTSSASMPLSIPNAVTAEKVKHEADEYNIYVGFKPGATEPIIQVNDQLVSKFQLDNLLNKVAEGKSNFEKLEVPIYLRVDKKVKMDLVYDVKLALRKTGLRKIQYIVLKDSRA